VTTVEESGATLPRLLLRNAAAMPARPALRERNRGIWQSLTWAAYAALVRDIALGLAAHGFHRGDRLAVLGDNRPRLYAAMLAAQSLGGAALPLDPDTEPARLASVLGEANASVVVAEDQEQVETVLSVKDRLADLSLIVCAAPRGLAPSERQMLHDFGAFTTAGRIFAATHPGYFEAEIAKATPDDPALLLAGAETDGLVALSHRWLLSTASSVAATELVRPTDNALCYLPMSTLGDAIYSLTLGLAFGFAGNCPEARYTVPRDLREIGPTILFAPPLVWRALARRIAEQAGGTSGLKRWTFALFRDIGLRTEERREQRAPLPLPLRLGRLIGEAVTYAPMRDKLGLNRLRWVHVGEEEPSAEIRRLFGAFGIRLKPGARIGPSHV